MLCRGECVLSYCRVECMFGRVECVANIGANGPSHGGVNGTHSHCN